MILKVCGMRDAENIKALDELHLIDWMGFIFYEPSKRHVNVKPDYLPINSKRVGVFVNYPTSDIIQKADEYELGLVQLHGTETPEQCKEIKALRKNIKIIKAFSIDKNAVDEKFQKMNDYESCCDYFLFDTATKDYGGSGKSFDWKVLKNYHGNTPFILSGGMSPTSIEALHSFQHNKWIGIDLNSGFETRPAMKNIDTINTFIKNLTKTK